MGGLTGPDVEFKEIQDKIVTREDEVILSWNKLIISLRVFIICSPLTDGNEYKKALEKAL